MADGDGSQAPDSAEPPEGIRSKGRRVWVLISEEDVPPRWKDRAVALSLIPLLPEEADGILRTGSTNLLASNEDEAVARLAARGASANDIARELHMTPRSVYRRLARLRDRLGARSSAELAARLNEHGF
jgi:DNA-binding NarL/FixJ family response regulator